MEHTDEGPEVAFFNPYTRETAIMMLEAQCSEDEIRAWLQREIHQGPWIKQEVACAN